MSIDILLEAFLRGYQGFFLWFTYLQQYAWTSCAAKTSVFYCRDRPM